MLVHLEGENDRNPKGRIRMPGSRFTEQQIVAALRQAEGGILAVEVCRKLGITEQTSVS